MESQYKVCEVKLTYKSKIKASEERKSYPLKMLIKSFYLYLILKQYSTKSFSKSF